MSEAEERPPRKINKIWEQEFRERSRNNLTEKRPPQAPPFRAGDKAARGFEPL
jgi:hypothetical protein